MVSPMVLRREAATMLLAAMELEGLSRQKLSQKINVGSNYVNLICRGANRVSTRAALLFESALPTLSAKELLYAQARDELKAARDDAAAQ